jgi:hypothetical protein
MNASFFFITRITQKNSLHALDSSKTFLILRRNFKNLIKC